MKHMRYTIEEHEKLQRRDEDDEEHWDIPRSEWATNHADLLAEVKRLQEAYKKLDAHECLYWRSRHEEIEARLADAVNTLRKIGTTQHSLPRCIECARLANECVARISGGGK